MCHLIYQMAIRQLGVGDKVHYSPKEVILSAIIVGAQLLPKPVN